MTDQEGNTYSPQSTAVISAPAPWHLQGNAYICLLRCPTDFLDSHSFISEYLQHHRKNDSYSLMMFVDYTQSPVGPYRELLFIPGRFQFEDGLQHLSISRIFVSSMASVVNGRNNWGIPKEFADFNVIQKEGVDRITIKRKGTTAVEIAFRSWPLPLPFCTALLPKVWHTLAQYHRGITFIYSPKASGWLRPAQLVEAHINPAEFPPINTEMVIGAVKITGFKMLFPQARVTPFLR